MERENVENDMQKDGAKTVVFHAAEHPARWIDAAVVEDDAGVRQSLAEILDSAADIRCVAACATAEEALHVLPPLRPGVVLLDIHLPGMNGVECAERLAGLLPETALLIVTCHDDSEIIFRALAAGASGCLLKPVRAAELLAAVRGGHESPAPMNGNIARKLAQAFNRPLAGGDGQIELSPQEREGLEYLAQGYRYEEVAEQMGVSRHTIHAHVQRIYHKLRARCRTAGPP